MPIGPKGQKRPSDVIATAVQVAHIATGEAEETYEKLAPPLKERERAYRRRLTAHSD